MVSPFVEVSVNPQSIYTQPTPTTVPLFIIPTRANKALPDGTGTALGTTESNNLRQFTSQRELLQALGNPVFVTSAGEPVHGDETNEYALLAAHSFAGIASQGYYIRPDVDLAALVPNTIEPTLSPPDGTYWIDKNAVVGGIFNYDGNSWNVVPFNVYTSPPTGEDGVNGDWAFDYSNSDGTIKFKSNGAWYAATTENLMSQFATNVELTPSRTAPISPSLGDFWYKTTSNSGGSDIQLYRYRAVDNTWIKQIIIRYHNNNDPYPPPNEGTILEDLSSLSDNGFRPLLIGNGSNFISLDNLFVQNEQPIGNPANGTLWFDDTINDFALYLEGSDMSRNNQWIPIETVTVSSPTNTQKVISGSAPSFPAVGAIWVDLSTPENIDNFPVIKRWSGAEWIDITDVVEITDSAPRASEVVDGTYWVNTGESKTRNIVKSYNVDYVPKTVILSEGNQYEVVDQLGNHWEPATGTKFGRKSQRDVVVEAMQSAIISNEDVRAESVYYQLIACPGYPELYDEMIALNTDNKEISFVVADTPKWMRPSGIPQGRETTAAEWITNSNNVAVTGEDGFSSAPSFFAAFYSPWGIGTNLDGEDVLVPPSHAALRAIAYSDSVSAPWFPPAGPIRGRVDNMSSVGYLNNNNDYQPLILNRAQRDVMYANNINPIVFVPNRGLSIMGQKTNAAFASALDRLNVSRLIIKMKYDLQRLFEPFLFSINDAVTRRSAQILTERYLAGLKSLRALYDYAARCDESNNTSERIDGNQLWIDVAIKPARAIEFIFVPISILGTGDELPF